MESLWSAGPRDYASGTRQTPVVAIPAGKSTVLLVATRAGWPHDMRHRGFSFQTEYSIDGGNSWLGGGGVTGDGKPVLDNFGNPMVATSVQFDVPLPDRERLLRGTVSMDSTLKTALEVFVL